jgi:hypothetical protein
LAAAAGKGAVRRFEVEALGLLFFLYEGFGQLVCRLRFFVFCFVRVGMGLVWDIGLVQVPGGLVVDNGDDR